MTIAEDFKRFADSIPDTDPDKATKVSRWMALTDPKSKGQHDKPFLWFCFSDGSHAIIDTQGNTEVQVVDKFHVN